MNRDIVMSSSDEIENVLVLQGGCSLWTFGCGVVKALTNNFGGWQNFPSRPRCGLTARLFLCSYACCGSTAVNIYGIFSRFYSSPTWRKSMMVSFSSDFVYTWIYSARKRGLYIYPGSTIISRIIELQSRLKISTNLLAIILLQVKCVMDLIISGHFHRIQFKMWIILRPILWVGTGGRSRIQSIIWR